MAGALFYAARFPVAEQAALDAQSAQAAKAEVESNTESVAKPAAIVEVSNPAFSLPDLKGTARDFSEWDGKHRVVNFWATWCKPCRKEIPVLKAFQDEHSDADLQVIGIAVDFVEDVTRYAEEAQFNYPVLIGQEDAMAVAEMSGIQFMALPFTMFVAADGEYLNAYMGELHAPQLADVANIFAKMDSGDLSRAQAKKALGDI